METLIALGRSIAPFAIDCTVKISLAAIAALLAAPLLGRRQSSRSFTFIVAAFALAAALLLARGRVRWDDGATTERVPATHVVKLVPEEDSIEPATTSTPGLIAKYGSMFQTRFTGNFPRSGSGKAIAAGASRGNGRDWIGTIGFIWIVGFAAISAYHLVGILALQASLSAAQPCTNRRLLRIAHSVRERLDVSHSELWLSPTSQTAFLTGIVHPRIVLPEDAIRWPDERLTSTLLHEHMHVKRFDIPVAEGLRLLASLAWFSPFPWLALSSALQLREEACDEAVVRTGIAPASYAADLLKAARSLSHAPRPSATAAISGGALLERRIRTILEGPASLPHCVLRSAAAMLLLAAAIGIAMLAGPLYSISRLASGAVLPQGPNEWIAAADPLSPHQEASTRGAFSISREGLYAKIHLHYGGRTTEYRLPAVAMPNALPLTGRARMIVPFGDLVDAHSREPFFHPGWSIWDNRKAPVRAAGAGRVVVDRIDPRYGPIIEVEHGPGLRTRYCLGRYGASTVGMGEFVLPGTELGSFGDCSPYDIPSLDFGVLINVHGEMVALDPAPFIFDSGANRETPLSASVINASIRLEDRAEVQRLIARGVSLNNVSADGTLPLEWVILTQNLAIAQDLVAAGADPRAATWDTHQAHIALHGPSIAEIAKDTASPELIALLAPE